MERCQTFSYKYLLFFPNTHKILKYRYIASLLLQANKIRFLDVPDIFFTSWIHLKNIKNGFFPHSKTVLKHKEGSSNDRN
ncbi:hypothetical protein BTO28_07520 [Domibacillus epiphyticus]|uniref:Uncharacterized protein n=1 Tax=Domibacillus epiphyticus TaxID=1714355 RepID=A0A1V2A8N2_9BACI|nr:hypothetical protein BTO28_07520 [Domibacillus epiphyticus]